MQSYAFKAGNGSTFIWTVAFMILQNQMEGVYNQH